MVKGSAVPDLSPRGADIRLRSADNHELSAYRVRSAAGPAAIVILQEIFGVNRHIRELCDAFAQRGFSVISPALFDRVRKGVELGYGNEDVETGRALRAQIPCNATLLDVQSAIDAVADDGPVAVMGFCWGGSMSFLAACRLKGLACAVSYYGAQTMPFIHEQPRVPVLMHFGEFDPRISQADRETTRRLHPEIEMHVFPADHGFNCDHRQAYDAASAQCAEELALAFIHRHLGIPAEAKT